MKLNLLQLNTKSKGVANGAQVWNLNKTGIDFYYSQISRVMGRNLALCFEKENMYRRWSSFIVFKIPSFLF